MSLVQSSGQKEERKEKSRLGIERLILQMPEDPEDPRGLPEPPGPRSAADKTATL